MVKPLVIVGCTASGKSDLAEAMALHLGGTVLAVDSMQVYRGMDIGTAKPDMATRSRIPHLMIDVADPWETYSAARFAREARPFLDAFSPPPPPPPLPPATPPFSPSLTPSMTPLPPHPRVASTDGATEGALGGGKLILVGGTILYLRALLEGLFEGPSAHEEIRAELEAEAARIGVPGLHARLAAVDEVAAGRIHPNDLRRIVRALEVHRVTGQRISDLQTQWNREHPAVDAVFIGVRREKEALNRRINARVRAMMAAGLVEEVRRLRDDPRGFSEEAASGVGYRQLLDYFAGKCTLEEAIEQIKIQTRHLAKLQRTWLKRFPSVHWLDAAEGQAGAELLEPALAVLAGEGRGNPAAAGAE